MLKLSFMSRILVILPRCIGDVLLTTPMLRQLRRLHPRAHIEAVCHPAARAVIEHNPHIDTIATLAGGRKGHRSFLSLVWKSLSTRYDIAIDAYSATKTAVLTRLTGAPSAAWLRPKMAAQQRMFQPAISSTSE